jgi:5-hydroxyisourate hydrolase
MRGTGVTTVTTHVLDATRGAPAEGLLVTLEPAGSFNTISVVTGPDGRAALGTVHPGVYEMTFATGDWFGSRGTDCFHPRVTVTFTVSPQDRHCHVPLLLSPFAYSTYRGS